MRPLIGITTSVNSRDYEVSNQSVVMLPETYPKAVQRAGGIPLLLSECDDSEELLDCLDGLIISGGRDINPKLYNQDANQKTIDFSDSQDKWETSLIEGAIERDMPLLCIAAVINCFASFVGVNYFRIFLLPKVLKNMVIPEGNGLNTLLK